MARTFDRSDILEFFLREANGHLQNLDAGVLSLEKDPSTTGLIDELFRSAHTLKGSAAMMGFRGMSSVAHKTECMLGMFRDGAVGRESLDFLAGSIGAIRRMAHAAAAGQPEDPLIVETVDRAFQNVLARVRKMTPPEPPLQEEESIACPAGASSRGAGIEAGSANDLHTAGETVFGDPGPAPRAGSGSLLEQEIEEAKRTGIRERRGPGRRAADALGLKRQFIRVDVGRLDDLMNLAGEMIVGRNRLTRRVDLMQSLQPELTKSRNRLLREIRGFEERSEHAPAGEASAGFPGPEVDCFEDFSLRSRVLLEITNDVKEIMDQLAELFESFENDAAGISAITAGLQNEITRVRTVELDRLYRVFRSPVQDLAREQGKEITMIVSGGETKIDTTIFGIIADPLMHLVRCAIVHGLEPAAERAALGKEPAGSLILRARPEGNSVVIDVEDDGRGMDPARLRKTAVEKGFLNADEARSLSDAEAVNLIFRPGFLTAARGGGISASDAGMDAVAADLARANARIEVITESGVGTRFSIRLPLISAVAQAFIVKLGDQELAFPANLVEETAQFAFKDILRTENGDRVGRRGTPVKLLNLNELLGVPLPKKDDACLHPALILGAGREQVALLVEEITGSEEIVIKSLGEYLKGIKLFSGATVSGDGNVRLIVNVPALLAEHPRDRTDLRGGRQAP